MANLKVKELLSWIEKNNIPEDAEIWMEYPQKYGVAQSTDENHCFEHAYSEVELTDYEFISGSTFGWSKEKNRIYIYHHY